MLRHDFLNELFAFCRTNGIGLALARPYRLELQGLLGDIDLVVERRDVPLLVAWIRAQESLTITAHYRRPDGETFFVYGIQSPGARGIAVDFITELSCKGLPYLSAREALLRSEDKGAVQCLHPVDEALLLLMTVGARHKTTVKDEYTRAIIESFRMHETALTEQLVTLLGDQVGIEIAEALRVERLTREEAQKILVAYLAQAYQRQSLLDVIAYRLNYMIAVTFHRFSTPRRTICFYGVDGAGKTTLIRSLKDDFKGMAHHVQYSHFKPLHPGEKEPDSDRVQSDPQGKTLRDPVTSMVKAVYYLVLHWICRFWPWPTDVLNISDRGIWDFHVDSKRFRYGGPMAFLHAVCRVTPKAFVSVIVDIPPETAQKRKQEVSLDESRRQAEAYRILASQLPNALIVRGDLPIETLRKTVCEYVLQRLAEDMSP